ncbi:MerR family transcriptional regulator [Kutzneria buriramensis]|uniref:MerR-like DNA binding protein n=1 Tax=Kutzneria buriramensis TaxID=1045776 RepID=A0A3E0GZW5_9PSEU|nr:MerR family transcriptional regulator [Kutzneria buriramensis]REH34904.1 MerR-like DNA binding protein [Kutzneria buriramensis]
MTSPGEPEWTPGALARMLGVSPNTLRTWDRRYGLGPTVREDGRHRRYSEGDERRLRRMVALTASGMSTAAAAAIARGESAESQSPGPAVEPLAPAAAVRGFLRAAARLDAPLMRDLARRLIAEHDVATAWEQVFTPVLVELGNGSAIEVEHMASASVQHALRQIPAAQERGRLPVLLACAPDEQHTLPLDALAAVLSERGCAHRSLGPRVPAPALVKAVDQLRPSATVVWAHTVALAGLVPLDDLLASGHTTVVVAGPGWMPEAVPPEVRQVRSLRGAVDVVSEICGIPV